MAQKSHFTVVRNAAYTAASAEVRERHNERKNENYYNADIVPEREKFNVHFCRYQFPDGTPVTYQQRFDQLLAAGTIVKRGLKADAKVIDELVFDVNTAYFVENGGYDFAKKFYEAAYRLAVKEVGGEDYILSAAMHADEKNTALSEQFGRDVYHYHLHVVYVPIVQKEILWSKRAKDKALIGKVKEVIPQISHSKKWSKYKDENGNWINEYSLLQDRFYEGMIAAGFGGFERGERGSTAEHLDVLDYKIRQDKKRLNTVLAQVEKKEARIEKLDGQIAVKEKAKAALAEVDAMGHSLPFVPGVHLTDDEAAKLKTLAKKSVNADDRIAAMKKKMAAVVKQLDDVQRQLADAKAEVNHWHREYTDLKNEVKDFLRLVKKFPSRFKEFFAGLFREEQAQAQQFEQERQAQRQQHKKSKSWEESL